MSIRKNKKIFFIIATALIILGVFMYYLYNNYKLNQNMETSIVQVIAHSGKYNKQKIIIPGYLLINEKGYMGHLYMSIEHADHGIFQMNIPVDLMNVEKSKWKNAQKKYVVIEGRFRKGWPVGHITDVVKITILEDGYIEKFINRNKLSP